MIPKLACGIALCCAGVALGSAQAQAAEPRTSNTQSPAPSAHEPDTSIEKHRAPFDAMSERLLSETMIGVASRPVRFDWRQKSVALGFVASQLLELNNFKTARYGLFARRPLGGWMGEMSLTRASTWGSPSTEKLARTPYRQVGRPSRFEMDVNLAYPLAEGVATARPGLFPATQLVLSAVAGLRYLFYPEVLRSATFGQVVRSFVAPRLSSRELRELESSRPEAMQIDRGRFNVLSGLNLDVYFGSGGLVSTRTLVAVPIAGSDLGWWWELSLAAGWMF